MKRAVIDIGTNTILLLAAELRPDGSFDVLTDEQRIARLGKGIDAGRRFSEEAFRRAEETLSAYRHRCDELGIESVTAVGTSALRDAVNTPELAARIRTSTGIRIEVLSGEDEALWTYRGGLHGLPPHGGRDTVIDIGGGSTELVTGNAEAVTLKRSFDIGSVRLTERYLRTSPPERRDLEAARRFVDDVLPSELRTPLDGTRLAGVAGTVTTLAAVRLGLTQYAPAAVHGHAVTLEEVRETFEAMKRLTLDDLRRIPPMAPGREDIILAGMLILLAVMERYGFDAVTASDRGLRYGILLRDAAGGGH